MRFQIDPYTARRSFFLKTVWMKNLSVLKIAAVFSLYLGLHNASAQSLEELYRLATASDPALAGSVAQNKAAQEHVTQAQAALLPNVSISSSLSKAHFDDHVNHDESNDRAYFNRQNTLQLNQALYRPVAWRTLSQTHVQEEAAQFQRDVACADLSQRVATSYFDVLTARSELVQFVAQKRATAEQLIVAQHSYERGAVSITDVREAQAKFDTVAAQAAAAEMDLQSKLAALGLVVGYPAQVDALQAGTQLPGLSTADLSKWIDAAEESNPQIQQTKRMLDAARLEVSKAKAGAYPTLDLTLSGQDNHSSATALVSYAQGGRIWQSGLTLNIPIYAGGAIQSKVKEALDMEEKSTSDLEAVRRAVGLSVRQSFYATLSAMAQFKGLLTAEKSNESAVEANLQGYKVGMRINAEVLTAEAQLYQTRRDMTKAWNDSWNNFIKLKVAAGIVSEKDLAEIDGLFLKGRSLTGHE